MRVIKSVCTTQRGYSRSRGSGSTRKESSQRAVRGSRKTDLTPLVLMRQSSCSLQPPAWRARPPLHIAVHGKSSGHVQRNQRVPPAVVVTGTVATEVATFCCREVTPVPTDSAPPTEPPVSDAGAAAEAEEPPCCSVHCLPFIWTCTRHTCLIEYMTPTIHRPQCPQLFAAAQS